MHYKKFLLATSSIVFFPDQNICPLTSPQPRLMGLFFASAGFQSGAIRANRMKPVTQSKCGAPLGQRVVENLGKNCSIGVVCIVCTQVG